MNDILELTLQAQKVVKNLKKEKQRLDDERKKVDDQIKTIEKMLGTLTPEDQEEPKQKDIKHNE